MVWPCDGQSLFSGARAPVGETSDAVTAGGQRIDGELHLAGIGSLHAVAGAPSAPQSTCCKRSTEM